MKRLVLAIALSGIAASYAAEPARIMKTQKRPSKLNPWRWAKALDAKLGDVSLELSAVKSGKPLNATKTPR